jgi:hypothetical protein
VYPSPLQGYSAHVGSDHGDSGVVTLGLRRQTWPKAAIAKDSTGGGRCNSGLTMTVNA